MRLAVPRTISRACPVVLLLLIGTAVSAVEPSTHPTSIVAVQHFVCANHLNGTASVDMNLDDVYLVSVDQIDNHCEFKLSILGRDSAERHMTSWSEPCAEGRRALDTRVLPTSRGAIICARTARTADDPEMRCWAWNESTNAIRSVLHSKKPHLAQVFPLLVHIGTNRAGLVVQSATTSRIRVFAVPGKHSDPVRELPSVDHLLGSWPHTVMPLAGFGVLSSRESGSIVVWREREVDRRADTRTLKVCLQPLSLGGRASASDRQCLDAPEILSPLLQLSVVRGGVHVAAIDGEERMPLAVFDEASLPLAAKRVLSDLPENLCTSHGNVWLRSSTIRGYCSFNE